jgi:mannitol/fructose-specific phosphotransferase system IIA component (Ntr-type)
VMISARGGSLSWRPGLDRLPRVLSQRYPKLSFVTAYPSEAINTAESRSGSEIDLIKENRIRLRLEDGLSHEIIRQILQTDETLHEEKIETIVSRLLESTADYKPEVMPGVLLFESHTSAVSKQKFFIGVSRDGVNVEQSASPVHIVLILISPAELSSDEHLNSLNSVVKLIRPGEVFRKIKNAESGEEIINTLRLTRQQNRISKVRA